MQGISAECWGGGNVFLYVPVSVWVLICACIADTISLCVFYNWDGLIVWME